MWAPSCSFRSAWPSPALLVPSRSSASRTRKAARQGARRGVRAGADEDTFLYVFVAVMKFYYFFIFFQGPPVMTLEVGPPAPGALKGMELCLF